jgi:hypothetical protein
MYPVDLLKVDQLALLRIFCYLCGVRMANY